MIPPQGNCTHLQNNGRNVIETTSCPLTEFEACSAGGNSCPLLYKSVLKPMAGKMIGRRMDDGAQLT